MNQRRSRNTSDEYTFTPSQVMSLITSTIIGVGVLTLPRSVTEPAQQSGWISVILGGLLSCVGLWLFLILGRMFPGSNIISIGRKLFGSDRIPVIGKIFSFPLILSYLVFWFFTAAAVARIFGEVVVTAVLVKTPLEVIVGTMLFVAFIMVMCEMEVMARIHEALLPILIIPVLLIALFSFQSANFIRLLPLFEVSWEGMLAGIIAAMFSFQGYDVITVYMNNMELTSERTTRAAMFGMSIPILVYTLIVIAGISAFGYEELQRLMWPTLELVKTTEVPGLILERLESAFLGVWVAAVFTTLASNYFTACFAAMQIFQFKTHRYLAVGFLPALYFTAMWPDNVHQLFQYVKYVAYYGMVVFFGSTLFMIVLALIRRGTRTADVQEEKQ